MFRGSKSRNKVSVGEPAEGSLLSFEVGLMLASSPMHVLSPALKSTQHLCTFKAVVLRNWSRGSVMTCWDCALPFITNYMHCLVECISLVVGET